MRVENIRAWQWMLIGAFVGLMFAVVKVYQGPWFDNADVDTLDQASFERDIINAPEAPWRGRGYVTRYHNDLPVIKDVVVHPPVGGDAGPAWWVTGKTYSVVLQHKVESDPKSPVVAAERWIPFKCPAKAPYRAVAARPGNYDTILDYLRVMKQNNPAAAPFTYAWWDKPLMPYVMLPSAGVLVLGFAWPATLSLLQSAGMARRREKHVKLAAALPSVKAAGPAVDTAAVRAQLDKLNEELETSLGGFGSAPAAVAASSKTSDRPAALSTGGVSAAVDRAPDQNHPEEKKDYGGEFYPVAKTAAHKK